MAHSQNDTTPNYAPLRPGYTLLQVDDSLVIRMLVQGWCEKRGHAYHGTTAWADFNELYKKHRTTADAALIDVELDAFDGRTAAHALTKLPGKRPAILLYSATRNLEEKAKECGADGAINKSTKEDDFFKLLRGYIGIHRLRELNRKK